MAERNSDVQVFKLDLNCCTDYREGRLWVEALNVDIVRSYIGKCQYLRLLLLNITIPLLVLGRSSIIIDNQSFTSLILINRLRYWQSIIIGKGDT